VFNAEPLTSLKASIGQWFREKHSTDPDAGKILDTTFAELLRAMTQGTKLDAVVSETGGLDTAVRDMVFQELADRLNLNANHLQSILATISNT